MIQQTLVLLKPDAIDRALVGRIIERFERAGLAIEAIRLTRPDRELLRRHYADLEPRNPAAFVKNTNYLAGKPMIAMVLSGVQAIQKVRALIGPTEPASAPPGTIRGDFSCDTIRHADSLDRGLYNLAHASDSDEAARREIEVWFPK